MIFFRYSSAAAWGSISIADRLGTAEICVIVLPIVCENTCPTLDAGSVLTKRTFFSLSANLIAVAHEIDVLPTPPLPVKNK